MTTTDIRPARELTEWERDLLAHHRELCADNAEAMAEVAETEAVWRTLPAPPPCPDWCEAASGHGWVDDVEWEITGVHTPCGRGHYRRFGENLFEVTQFELASTDGTIYLGPPDVRIDWDTQQREPITDSARLDDLATGLRAATDLLERIQDERAEVSTVR